MVRYVLCVCIASLPARDVSFRVLGAIALDIGVLSLRRAAQGGRAKATNLTNKSYMVTRAFGRGRTRAHDKPA